MRIAFGVSLAIAAFVAAAPALAGTLIPIVPVPNSTSTNVFGINESNVITGSWIDSGGVEHGYVGPLDGSNYTLFDDPTPGTEPRAINDKGAITGFANSQNGDAALYIPFERFPDGTIRTVTKKRKALNYIAQGIDTSGTFAGSYYNASLVPVGYLGSKAKFRSKVKLSITNTGTAPRAVDDAGDVVGWYFDASGVMNGFLISAGTATMIDYPNSSEVYTVLEGINDKGAITGQWADSSGVIHGFVYYMSTGKFKPITVPGSVSFVQAWGISNDGIVAVGSDKGYFVYCTKAKGCPGGGIEVADREIKAVPGSLPSYPCRNGCIAPQGDDPVHVPAIAPNAVRPHVAPHKPAPLAP